MALGLSLGLELEGHCKSTYHMQRPEECKYQQFIFTDKSLCKCWQRIIDFHSLNKECTQSMKRLRRLKFAKKNMSRNAESEKILACICCISLQDWLQCPQRSLSPEVVISSYRRLDRTLAINAKGILNRL